MTKDYYGTKRVTARYQDREGQPGYAVKYEDGYTSWSPMAAFEGAYQPVDAMSFGHAIHAMKHGHRVARRGWNGKGMFICILEGSLDGDMFCDGIPHPCSIDGVDVALFNKSGDSGTVTKLPCIGMRTATGSVLHGWLASQTDMLADDWCFVEVLA